MTPTASYPRPRVAALALAALVALRPAPADAQNAPDLERAFADGVALLERHQYAEAVQRLEEARALREAPAILLNLALAQRGLGRFVEADRTLARYLELAAGRIRERRRAEVDALRAEIRAAVAQLTLRVGPLPAGVSVSLDGRRLGDGDLNRPIDVDPIEHVVRVEGAGVAAHDLRRAVAPGEHADIALLLPEAARPEPTATVVAPPPVAVVVRPAVPDPRTGPAPEAPPRSIATRWWFWTGLGAVAAGTAVGLAVGLSSTESPAAGSLNRVIQAAVTF